jgi:hypothetical protein
VAETKFVIGVAQRSFERVFHRSLLNKLTDAKRHDLELDEIVNIGRRRQFVLHPPSEIVRSQKSFERGGGNRKAIRHFHAVCPQRPQTGDLRPHFRVVFVGQLA